MGDKGQPTGQLGFVWQEAGEAEPEPTEGSRAAAASDQARALATGLMQAVVEAATCGSRCGGRAGLDCLLTSQS